MKYMCSDGQAIEIKWRTHSLTNGRIRALKRYTAATIDWIAAYDMTSDRCYYVPAHLLGDGRILITLRLSPSRNQQMAGSGLLATTWISEPMEPAGLEPATFAMQARRSPS